LNQVRSSNEIEITQNKHNLKKQAKELLEEYIDKLNNKFKSELGKKIDTNQNKRMKMQVKDDEINLLRQT
jgi:hypothetical protein